MSNMVDFTSIKIHNFADFRIDDHIFISHTQLNIVVLLMLKENKNKM